MGVVANVKSVLRAETLESFILPNFSQRDHLDGSLGHDLAVEVDLVDDMGESVELSDSSLGNLDFGEGLLVEVDEF